MTEAGEKDRTTVELTPDELQLVHAALRLFLRSEDDTETIIELKALLARLPVPGA